MVSAGSALFRYYNRILTTSSSSSSGITPIELLSCSVGSTRSSSVAACTSDVPAGWSIQSGGSSDCENPRKRKQSSEHRQRRRSNLVVALLTWDVGLGAPNPVPNVCPQVITLSSDASTATAETVDAKAKRARKGKSSLPVVDELDDLSDEEFIAEEKVAGPRRSYEATRKFQDTFQDTWAARLPWAELFRGFDGLFEYVKCVVCSQVTGKPKILEAKWDTLSKHSGKRKATKILPQGIKKGQWYIAKNCKHLRYERIYASRNTVTVAQQLAVVKGERARKRIQFATILHLLQEGHPMLEYAALQGLLTFLEVPKLPRHHWSDKAGWEFAECLFQQVQLRIKEVMKGARFFSVTCDKVTTLNTQSWISIHGYMYNGWERKPILLSLERVLDGGGSNNLTTVIVEAIKNYGGITKADLAMRFASFSAGKKNSVVNQLQTTLAPRLIGIHCMAHKTNLVVRALSSLPVIERIEDMLASLHAFFAKSTKRHLEFVKLAELMHSKGLEILRNVKTR